MVLWGRLCCWEGFQGAGEGRGHFRVTQDLPPHAYLYLLSFFCIIFPISSFSCFPSPPLWVSLSTCTRLPMQSYEYLTLFSWFYIVLDQCFLPSLSFPSIVGSLIWWASQNLVDAGPKRNLHFADALAWLIQYHHTYKYKCYRQTWHCASCAAKLIIN